MIPRFVDRGEYAGLRVVSCSELQATLYAPVNMADQFVVLHDGRTLIATPKLADLVADHLHAILERHSRQIANLRLHFEHRSGVGDGPHTGEFIFEEQECLTGTWIECLSVVDAPATGRKIVL